MNLLNLKRNYEFYKNNGNTHQEKYIKDECMFCQTQESLTPMENPLLVSVGKEHLLFPLRANVCETCKSVYKLNGTKI